ncbi:hypothetical protein PENTCL1PPCAC_5988, partial [Pristionchus entomophagus]
LIVTVQLQDEVSNIFSPSYYGARSLLRKISEVIGVHTTLPPRDFAQFAPNETEIEFQRAFEATFAAPIVITNLD